MRNIKLKLFQQARTGELTRKFLASVRDWVDAQEEQSLALSAPTGSGKTVIATEFIERVLLGFDQESGDDQFVFLWLTDQPQLNEQTARKMHSLSNLDEDQIQVITETFNEDQLQSGKVYFLNTQKLGASSSLVTRGDKHPCTLWEALANTINRDSSHFVLIIDEAHRGMKESKSDPEFAKTIVQKFIKGSDEVPRVPLIIGISATIQRFHDLMGETGRTERKVEVTVDEVRESGLVKDAIILRNPERPDSADTTMLVSGIAEWKEFRELWSKQAAKLDQPLLDPILLVQVEDGNEKVLSRSPLKEILATIYDHLNPESPDWVAHAFQTGTNLPKAEYGAAVRHIDPADIDSDADVRVVLFKSSLNTGWDCPRAEVMVSFRPAKDPTNIAQLVGRMVRARLAEPVEVELLNTVSLYIPRYDSEATERIVSLLNGAGGEQTASVASLASDTVWLKRSKLPHMEAAFEALSRIPTMSPPPKVSIRPIEKLFRLAGLLAETKLHPKPVEEATNMLVGVLVAECEKRRRRPAFEASLKEAATVTVVSRTHRYGTTTAGAPSAGVATQLIGGDLDERFAMAEQAMDRRGLSNAYLKVRLGQRGSEEHIKAELCVVSGLAMATVEAKATTMTDGWLREWRDQLAALKDSSPEKYVRYEELRESTDAPTTKTIPVPEGSVRWTKHKKQGWKRHMYAEDNGSFVTDLNAWEGLVMRTELSNPKMVAWLRNPIRKPWSLCVVYESGAEFNSVFPDFILFHLRDDGNLKPSIADPHRLDMKDAAQRAASLAEYAKKNRDAYDRIDLIIVELTGAKVPTIRRLDLMDVAICNKVAKATSKELLEELFANAPPYP